MTWKVICMTTLADNLHGTKNLEVLGSAVQRTWTGLCLTILDSSKPLYTQLYLTSSSTVSNLYNKQTLSMALRPGLIGIGPGLELEEPTTS